MRNKRTFSLYTTETDQVSATTATAIPSAATTGSKTPDLPDFNSQLLVEMTAAAAPLSAHIEIWGYNVQMAKWFFMEDIPTVNGESGTTTFRFSKLIQGASAYSRLHARFKDLPGGTTPVYNTWFMFS